jgi:hypothetical protein
MAIIRHLPPTKMTELIVEIDSLVSFVEPL